MKLSKLITLSLMLVLACFALGVTASPWDKDDYEIFELQNALEQAEGKGTTFYSILDVAKSASQPQIRKAYRKKSVLLHPDKNQGVPGAQKRFERLGLLYKILQDGRRDRYDHFLSNGFPKWRGTGYYYERFRPGLVSVFVGIILASAGVELLVKKFNTAQEKNKLINLRRSAQLVAWGPRFQSDQGAEKKVRVPLAGFDLPPQPKQDADWEEEESKMRKAMATGMTGLNGHARTVDVLVSKDNVLVHDKASDEWLSLNDDAIVQPTFTQTWPFRIFRRGEKEVGHKADEVEQEARDVIASAQNGAVKKRKGKKQ